MSSTIGRRRNSLGARSGTLHSGAFQFEYDYQRADLDVRGPSFYSSRNGSGTTVYTVSGMAAISALLMATAQVFGEADVLIGSNSYAETIELIDVHLKQLKQVVFDRRLDEVELSLRPRPRILLVDSSTSWVVFETALRCTQLPVELIIFDTTCFSSGSGKISRVLNYASRASIPVVLVRSHNKLDSLGVEYGRLGSAVFIEYPCHAAGLKLLQNLHVEMRNAVRLFGGAALPAHFPPYVGGQRYRALTDKRVASMLLNNRKAAQYFSKVLPGLTGELHSAHGLYVTLLPAEHLEEHQTRDVTGELCADMERAGLPLRHAGSFGFDFGAAEWSRDRIRGCYVVRIAAPDLPSAAWDQVIEAVASWWKAHQSKRKSRIASRPEMRFDRTGAAS